MTIKVFTNGFDSIIIPNIDASTFRFYGPTDGYSYPESKKYDHSTIGFVVENAHEIVEAIRAKFKLNPEYCKVEDYIWVRDKFDDYVEDKRPRVGIRLSNGAQGFTNPPQFEFSND